MKKSKPTVTPFLTDGGVKYRLGSTANSRTITLSAPELEGLRTLINQALGAHRAGTP
jgi:hypothetical protein